MVGARWKKGAGVLFHSAQEEEDVHLNFRGSWPMNLGMGMLRGGPSHSAAAATARRGGGT